MMIVKANPEQKVEKISWLKDLQPGDVFRLREFSFEECLTGKDEATFYMMTALKGSDVTRVTVISVDGKNQLQRDGDRGVYKHEASITVAPNI